MGRNGYQHMVLDEYVDRVREIHRQRKKKLNQITTRSQAEAYQRDVREAIERAFGPHPGKTPLNAQVTGLVERPAYRVEKVTFESRPGCLVTANLYVPYHLTGPAPCVLGSCGHAEAGKAEGLYQAFCQRLVHSGFVVLIYDPYSQGERDQYYSLAEREALGWGTRAHNMMGKQLELLGEFFGMWRAWDGIRALDYLLSRPEADPSRVGLTGNSGGGTMTTWLWAIEERFTMAAPGCFVTTFLHNLENELPADCEQCPPGVLGAGLDMADFFIAAAPKPVVLLGQRYDFFDRRGLQDAYEDLRRFYRIWGAPEENVQLSIGPQGHGYSVHNQEAMVAFFARHAGVPVVQSEATDALAPEALFATTQGQVVAAGATPIYKLIAERAQEYEVQRRPLDAAALKAQLGQLLALPSRRRLPHYRNLRPVHRDDEVLARTAVETGGHSRAILWKRLTLPEQAYSLDVEPEVRLYLPHLSSESDLAQDPLAVSLKATPPLYALDVRGLGESMPEEEHPDFFQPYGTDYMLHAYGVMLGQSYLGQRVCDVLSTIDLLVHEGARSVHLYGRGQGAILALFAALLHRRVESVTLKNGPTSFAAWAQAPLVAWPAANFVWGVLKVCDVPDCARLLGSRLQIIEPWGPAMLPE